MCELPSFSSLWSICLLQRCSEAVVSDRSEIFDTVVGNTLINCVEKIRGSRANATTHVPKGDFPTVTSAGSRQTRCGSDDAPPGPADNHFVSDKIQGEPWTSALWTDYISQPNLQPRHIYSRIKSALLSCWPWILMCFLCLPVAPSCRYLLGNMN